VYALLRQDEMVKAKGMFRLGIQQFQKANNVIGLAYAIGGLASLLVKQDQPEHAERLFAWSDAVREKFNDLRPLLNRLLLKGIWQSSILNGIMYSWQASRQKDDL